MEQQLVSVHMADDMIAEDVWGIAVESPVEITINGAPWTVLLATPDALEDLVVGLLVTEGIVAAATAVREIHIDGFLQETRVAIALNSDDWDATKRRTRTLASGTSCGLCGIESLAQLQAHRPERVGARQDITDAAILRAVAELPAQQPLNRATRSVHAAAWCLPNGDIALVREDVGRHNALDKLIGALARADRLTEPGFVLMSSRCSYELVAKACAANTQLLASISAPTSLALSWARALALPLVSVLRGTSDRPGAPSLVHFPSEIPHAVG
jgi:formate dehydrogenase accessory protein FdhD